MNAAAPPLAPGFPPGWRPAFVADWAGAVFLHWKVEPEVLQRSVPFALDLHEGAAWVSAVAFTMERMRPAWLPGRAGEWLLRPIAPCRFLNLRTYVRHRGRPGIFFLSEWLSRWLNIPLGPSLYGLPYHAGRLDFRHDAARRRVEVEVRGRGGKRLEFRGEAVGERCLAQPGSLPHFLLERYLAFTSRRGQSLAFRVRHEPWEAWPMRVQPGETSLLALAGPWASAATLAGAHWTPGVRSVAMGPPEAIAASANPRAGTLPNRAGGSLVSTG